MRVTVVEYVGMIWRMGNLVIVVKNQKINNMNYNSREEVKNLKTKFCNEIENLFKLGETIEFNNPFTVYVQEENTYDASYVKVPYIVKTMSDGQYLTGTTHYGDEFDDLSTYDLDDIVEVAYVLDTIGDKQYKLLQDETK
jgi:hypothetical protein